MQEHSSHVAESGAIIFKALTSAGVIGAFAGAIGFLFLWPKDRKEGFTRIFFSAVSSHFFGDAVLRTIIKFADWIPIEEARAGAYLLAGLPAWFIGAAVFKYFSKDNDIQQMARDAKEII